MVSFRSFVSDDFTDSLKAVVLGIRIPQAATLPQEQRIAEKIDDVISRRATSDYDMLISEVTISGCRCGRSKHTIAG